MGHTEVSQGDTLEEVYDFSQFCCKFKLTSIKEAQ